MKTENRIKLDKVEQESEKSRHYGFNAYRVNGYSMPKGFITSYVACMLEPNGKTVIEFSIQSPTGDASDHFNYTIPCESWEQAVWIVDMQYVGYEIMLDEYEKEFEQMSV